MGGSVRGPRYLGALCAASQYAAEGDTSIFATATLKCRNMVTRQLLPDGVIQGTSERDLARHLGNRIALLP